MVVVNKNNGKDCEFSEIPGSLTAESQAFRTLKSHQGLLSSPAWPVSRSLFSIANQLARGLFRSRHWKGRLAERAIVNPSEVGPNFQVFSWQPAQTN